VAEEQVLIVIMGKDQASKIFGQLGKNAEQAGKKVEKGLNLEKLGKQMTGVGKKLSLGLTAPLGVFAGVAVNAAMKSERLTKTLTGLAGGADEAEKYITAIGEASLGTVSRLDALAAANRALSFGVVRNTDEMKQLTEVAITLGRAQGLDAATAVSDFTTALSRNSPLILDNLGITLKLTEAYAIYSEKIGKSANALTAEEKAIAFREAALIKGMDAVEKMGGLQDDMAASAERVKAQMEDVAVTVGNSLIPIMSAGLDVVGPLVQAFSDADPAIQQVVVVLGGLAAAAGPVLMVTGKMLENAKLLNEGWTKLGTKLGMSGAQAGIAAAGIAALVYATKELIETLGDLERDEKRATEGVQDWSSHVLQAVSEGQEYADVVGELSDKANLVSKKWKDMTDAQRAFATATGHSAADVKQFAMIQEEVQQIAIAGSQSYETYKARIDEWNASVTDAGHRLEYLTEQQHESRLAVGRWIDGLIEGGRALQEVEQAAREYNWTIDDYITTAGLVGQKDDERRRRAEEHAAQLEADAQGVADLAAAEVAATAQMEATAARKDELAQQNAEAYRARAAAAEEAAAREVAAAEEAIAAQAGLISALKDATEEQFKQTLFAQVDPKDVGLDAWSELGKELGLLDDVQINLASGMQELLDNIDVIPLEDFGEAADAVFKAAQEGNPDFEATVGHFKEISPMVEPIATGMADTAEGFLALNEQLPGAVEGLGGAREQVDGLSGKVGLVAGEIDLLGIALGNIAKDWRINVYYEQHGGPPQPPSGYQQQSGGVWQQGGMAQLHPNEVVLPLTHPRGQEALTNAIRQAMSNVGSSVTNNNMTVNDKWTGTHLLAQMRQQQRFEQMEAIM
jgi:hypothetical protein